MYCTSLAVDPGVFERVVVLAAGILHIVAKIIQIMIDSWWCDKLTTPTLLILPPLGINKENS